MTNAGRDFNRSVRAPLRFDRLPPHTAPAPALTTTSSRSPDPRRWRTTDIGMLFQVASCGVEGSRADESRLVAGVLENLLGVAQLLLGLAFDLLRKALGALLGASDRF